MKSRQLFDKSIDGQGRGFCVVIYNSHEWWSWVARILLCRRQLFGLQPAQKENHIYLYEKKCIS